MYMYIRMNSCFILKTNTAHLLKSNALALYIKKRHSVRLAIIKTCWFQFLCHRTCRKLHKNSLQCSILSVVVLTCPTKEIKKRMCWKVLRSCFP